MSDINLLGIMNFLLLKSNFTITNSSNQFKIIKLLKNHDEHIPYPDAATDPDQLLARFVDGLGRTLTLVIGNNKSKYAYGWYHTDAKLHMDKCLEVCKAVGLPVTLESMFNMIFDIIKYPLNVDVESLEGVIFSKEINGHTVDILVATFPPNNKIITMYIPRSCLISLGIEPEPYYKDRFK